MVSPAPSEIEERSEYFDAWLLDNSTLSQRRKVTDAETAKEFIREIFGADTGLSHLKDGMDSVPSTYERLVKGKMIQGLISENTGEAAPQLTAQKVPSKEYRLTTKTSLSQLIPKEDKALRELVIREIYTPKVQETIGYKWVVDKRGRVLYRNRQGRFTSSGQMLREGDKYVKASPKTRGKVERVLRLERATERL